MACLVRATEIEHMMMIHPQVVLLFLVNDERSAS